MKPHEWRSDGGGLIGFVTCVHCGCSTMRPAQSGPCRARATKAEWDAYRRADYDGLRAEFGLPSCTNAEWSEQGDGWEP